MLLFLISSESIFDRRSKVSTSFDTAKQLGIFICSRQDFGLWSPFVASIPPRRNNSKKIWPNYLEIAKTRRNFASDLRIERYNG
jgi:hypothetical protein